MNKDRWMNECDVNKHHILFQRRTYEKMGQAALWLRANGGLIIPMDVQIHQDLHQDEKLFKGFNAGYLPRQDWYALKDSFQDTAGDDNGLDRVEDFIHSSEKLGKRNIMAKRLAEMVARQMVYLERGARFDE